MTKNSAEKKEQSFRLPYAPCYVEALEYWLNQKAETGLILKNIRRDRASLSSENTRIAYHIAPSHKGIAAFLKNYGWKPGCRLDSFLTVYENTSKDPHIPVIDKESSDFEIYRLVKQKEEKRWFLRSILIPMICMMLLVAAAVFYTGQGACILLRNGVLFGTAGLVFIGAVWILVLFQRLRALRSWFESSTTPAGEDFYSKIKKRSKKWPEQDRFFKIGMWICLAVILLEAVIILSDCLMHRKGSMENWTGSYVTLSDLEEANVEEADVDGFNNYFTVDRSLFVPVQQSLYQGGNVDGEERALRICLYRASSGSLAEDLLMARRSEELSWNSYLAEYSSELELEGADEAWYAGYMSMQYLFLRKGDTVITVFYLGSADLAEKGDLFLSMMQ